MIVPSPRVFIRVSSDRSGMIRFVCGIQRLDLRGQSAGRPRDQLTTALNHHGTILRKCVQPQVRGHYFGWI